MAFSIRKMLSNINYFKKLTDDEDKSQNENSIKKRRYTSSENSLEQAHAEFEHIEIGTDSTCFSISQDKPESSQEGAKPNSVEVLEPVKPKMHKNKKLKLDMMQLKDNLDLLTKEMGEPNTPKVVSMGLSATEIFTKRLQQFDMSKSFDLFDEIENVDALSTDSESSLSSEYNDKTIVKMCRKIDSFDEISVENLLTRSTTPESFADMEAVGNDDERLATIHSYQNKIEKIDYVLKNVLTDFQFHIEITKIFGKKAIVPAKNDSLLHLSQLIDKGSRIDSPINWDFVQQQEDDASKEHLKNQLVGMRDYINNFLNAYLKSESSKDLKSCVPSIMFRENHKRLRVNKKKKQRRLNDFPDFNEALRKLFAMDCDDIDCHSESPNCLCQCHQSTIMEDSIKDDTNYSIYSSIGNFTLDSATLTVYSESLDNIIDLSSFEESNLYSTMLNKTSIERLTFYIHVHNIHIQADGEIDVKGPLKFICVTCDYDTEDENAILKHILSQYHCEKIHFQYKSAYIKKCLSSGKEMQPSTVLNPMTMYRDLNKIVCFGDAMYACTLCFESLIVGESVLMAHCSEVKHVEKRGMLKEFLESF